MFRALDYVNYNNLQLNNCKQDSLATAAGTTSTPQPQLRRSARSLQELCCASLNASVDMDDWRWGTRTHHNWRLLRDAVRNLPEHMMATLFRMAMEKMEAPAMIHMISAWPYPTLCLREFMPRRSRCPNHADELEFESVISLGLLDRKRCCRMSCLDLRGFKLNKSFTEYMVLLPFISLPRKVRSNIKRLKAIVIQNAGMEDTGPVASQFAQSVERTLTSMVGRCSNYIRHLKGRHLVVKVDSLLFTPTEWLCQDYLVVHCLRNLTPIRLQVSQLYFRNSIYHIRTDNDLMLSPYAVLNGHETEFLEGLSLRQLEDGVFKMVAPVLYRFTNLQAIELQDCNIYLQNGRTRSKTEDRMALCSFLSSFPRLIRLDLSFNYLVGCLGEVLDAVQMPLQYLGLRGCDLDVTDFQALASSKHAASLRELNISKLSLCSQLMYFIGQPSTAPMEVVTALKSFPRLNVLNLSQMSLPDAQLEEMCVVLRNSLRELKMLDLAAMVMSPQHQVEVCLACASIPCFQKLSITLVTSLVEELNQWNGAEVAMQTITNKLRAVGRSDIRIETVLFSRAIFQDVVDDLQF